MNHESWHGENQQKNKEPIRKNKKQIKLIARVFLVIVFETVSYCVIFLVLLLLHSVSVLYTSFFDAVKTIVVVFLPFAGVLSSVVVVATSPVGIVDIPYFVVVVVVVVVGVVGVVGVVVVDDAVDAVDDDIVVVEENDVLVEIRNGFVVVDSVDCVDIAY